MQSEKYYLNQNQYDQLYQQSIRAPETFWAAQANQFITWIKPWDKVKTGGFEQLDIQWFQGAKLNACYNCVDRHLETRRDQTAILWEGDDPAQKSQLTYGELHQKICQLANAIKKLGLKKGDRVCIYLPMIPEAAIAMLACARLGVIHSVVFGGFSPESLQARILDADCHLVITADEGLRGGKTIPLKKNTDQALTACPQVKKVIVVKRTGNAIAWDSARDLWYHDLIQAEDTTCAIEPMDANDPLFILYTSGSTGKPKGILHTTAGYLVYVAMTHHYVFNYHDGDIYWCTADVGWITGHSYGIYGPLANGATTLLFEGIPSYPNFSRFWEIIDRYQVNIFYTAPTAIRALRREGDEWVKKTSRRSLKLLGTVGEPINPDVWQWYDQVVGESRCPVVDTWWQTETGGILITPLPGVTTLKPGSATKPFFGIEPDILNDQGEPLGPNQHGNLVIKQPWPGLAKTIYGNPERFRNTYFKPYPGVYLTGDEAYRDSDNDYWILGRNDDVIKVSGHRLGTGELESALLAHPAVSEAAVVAIPDDIKGQAIYAYVTLKSNVTPSPELKQALIKMVRDKIGPIATPKVIQWADSLPKTRSGKIMRRILRKIACGELHDLGDTSTLAEPSVVDLLIAGADRPL